MACVEWCITAQKSLQVESNFTRALLHRYKNKNGYEIRTKVLEFAQAQAWQDYHAKWGAWETTVKKDGDTVVTEVTMPDVPGADTVLETAEKFYNFVSGNINKK